MSGLLCHRGAYVPPGRDRGGALRGRAPPARTGKQPGRATRGGTFSGAPGAEARCERAVRSPLALGHFGRDWVEVLKLLCAQASIRQTSRK